MAATASGTSPRTYGSYAEYVGVARPLSYGECLLGREGAAELRERLRRRRRTKRPAVVRANPVALLPLTPAHSTGTQTRSRQSAPKPTRRKSERPDSESEPPPAAIADWLWRLEADYRPLPVARCECDTPIPERWPGGRLGCFKCGQVAS